MLTYLCFQSHSPLSLSIDVRWFFALIPKKVSLFLCFPCAYLDATAYKLDTKLLHFSVWTSVSGFFLKTKQNKNLHIEWTLANNSSECFSMGIIIGKSNDCSFHCQCCSHVKQLSTNNFYLNLYCWLLNYYYSPLSTYYGTMRKFAFMIFLVRKNCLCSIVKFAAKNWRNVNSLPICPLWVVSLKKNLK